MPDWAAIKEEYITGDIGLRSIAEKHGVSFNTIKDRAKREGWGDSRREYRLSMGMPAAPKVTPQIPHHTTPPVVYVPGEQQRENTSRLFCASEQLLDKVTELIPRIMKAGEAKSLSEALKNIKEIQMIKTALDEREQIARIEKLKADTKASGENNEPVEIVFVGRTEGAAR